MCTNKNVYNDQKRLLKYFSLSSCIIHFSNCYIFFTYFSLNYLIMYMEGRTIFKDLDTSIKLDNGEISKMLAMLFIINLIWKTYLSNLVIYGNMQ